MCSVPPHCALRDGYYGRSWACLTKHSKNKYQEQIRDLDVKPDKHLGAHSHPPHSDCSGRSTHLVQTGTRSPPTPAIGHQRSVCTAQFSICSNEAGPSRHTRIPGGQGLGLLPSPLHPAQCVGSARGAGTHSVLRKSPSCAGLL